MRRIDWDQMIRALALVHMGQQLGTDSKLSQAVYCVGELLLSIWR
jgi:hypothetical protein